MLEFVGIALAAWGIRSTRRNWAPDVPGVEGRAKLLLLRAWTRLRGWLRIRRHVTVHVGEAAMTITSAGSARGIVSLGPAQRRQSLRQRIRRLERELRNVERRMNQADTASYNRDADLHAAIQAETIARDELAAEHKRQLRDLAAGSLRLEATGLSMILMGTLLSNLASEIANAIRDAIL